MITKTNKLFIIFLHILLVLCPFGLQAQKNPSLVYDIEGNKYRTVLIGQQKWMAGNLKSTKLNDGTKIPNITDMTDWVRTTSPAYSWYDNDISNKEIYGGLYNWHTVNTGKLCPEGWHVPTDNDWTTLLKYIDGKDSVVKNMEEFGFPVIPGGYRYGYYWGSGIFYEKNKNAYLWTSTKATDTHIWSRTINSEYSRIYRSYFTRNNGFSVRCLKSSGINTK